MAINTDVLGKPKTNIQEKITIVSPENILELKDVQAIRNAIREHLLFIGLDTQNNVRNVSVLGIGTVNNVQIDTKEIVRMALLTASQKVILVHNHPSNSITPSNPDKHITAVSKELLNTFSIELLDHIIVTENEFFSMKRMKEFGKEKKNESINFMSKSFLMEENERLKNEISELKEQLNVKEQSAEEQEDELEM